VRVLAVQKLNRDELVAAMVGLAHVRDAPSISSELEIFRALCLAPWGIVLG